MSSKPSPEPEPEPVPAPEVEVEPESPQKSEIDTVNAALRGALEVVWVAEGASPVEHGCDERRLRAREHADAVLRRLVAVRDGIEDASQCRGPTGQKSRCRGYLFRSLITCRTNLT